MKTQKMKCKPPSPGKLALCIASALALGGFSGQVAAACGYTTTAQLLCDDQTIYYYGNPLSPSNGRDYTSFDETVINTSQNGTTTPLQGWGVYLDSTGYKFKNLVINTTGSEADGIHSKNAGGRLEAENITITTTGTSSDGINLGRELTSAYSVIDVSGNVSVDASDGMGLRANISRANTSAQSSIIVHGNADIVTRGSGGANSGYGIYAGRISVTYLAVLRESRMSRLAVLQPLPLPVRMLMVFTQEGKVRSTSITSISQPLVVARMVSMLTPAVILPQ